MRHVYSFSGGKDSTAMVLMALERGLPVDEVVFFDTGWEFPQIYDHIDLFEKKTGLKVVQLKPRVSLDYLMLERVISKGKHMGMRGYGFPWSMGRYCTREKQDQLDAYARKIGECKRYVGIAADETKRIGKNKRFKHILPLVEWGVTEKDALEYCKKHGYHWGGLYNYFKRVSCWLCPLQSRNDLYTVFEKFPHLKQDFINRARTLEQSRRQQKEEYIAKGEPVPDWCDKPVYVGCGHNITMDKLLEKYEVWLQDKTALRLFE